MMRTLKRNQQTIYYSNYTGKVKNLLGEMMDSYTEPIKAKANVSVPLSDASRGVEGTVPSYDKVLIADRNLPVDINTIFYIDKTPEYFHGQVLHYDYIATRVQKSLNHIRIELTRVEE